MESNIGGGDLVLTPLSTVLRYFRHILTMSDDKKIKTGFHNFDRLFSKNAGFLSDTKTDVFFEFSDIQNLGET